MYTLIKTEGKARRGQFETVHGTFQTPCFMNVGTAAAIKGGISSIDLKNDLKCQVELCNTYHLHVRPGDKVIKQMGGLHKFMNWDKPILTDSGGFQVFSLAKLRKIKEEGVCFNSHVDGRKIFMGPEESMQIQSNLGSTIAMAFDECIDNHMAQITPDMDEKAKNRIIRKAYDYSKNSCDRTVRWLYRCKEEMTRLNSLPDTINKHQLLFGINQGSVFDDLRLRHMEEIAKLDMDGYAVGGLAVGEPTEEMYHILDILSECAKAGNPDMVYKIGSTAKITFPGSAISAIATSKANIEDMKKQMNVQFISHDKINQLRHVRFFKNLDGIKAQMAKHAAILCPKFEAVDEILNKELGGLEIGKWTKPNGGYFVSFDSLDGCAKAIVAKCKDAGVVMTGAGATYPYGKDPHDSNIRIAPSFPTLEDLKLAAEIFCVCVKLVSIDKLLAE